MTRIEFYNDCLARYLREGMAIEAARARASAVTSSHFLEGQLTDEEFYKDAAEDGIYR